MLRGSNSMPTETKKRTAKGVAQRQRVLGRTVAEVRLGHDHAGEEAPSASDTPK